MSLALGLAIDIQYTAHAVLLSQVAYLSVAGQRGEAREVARIVAAALVALITVAAHRALHAHPCQANGTLAAAVAIAAALRSRHASLRHAYLARPAIAVLVAIDTEPRVAIADPRLALLAAQ
jgi:hypothetical protein